MRIVLGSTSTSKRETLTKALEGKFAYTGIERVEVQSGVSDQPLSIEQTVQGATNRAKQAYELQPNYLAVGMEGGLEAVGGIYNLVCAVAFWDGEALTVGQSGHLPLPKAVSDKVKAGGNFGELIREYQKTAPPEEVERINQLISRELSFTSAIDNALPQLKRLYGHRQLDYFQALLDPKQGWLFYFRLTYLLIAAYYVMRTSMCLASTMLGLMYSLRPFPYMEFYDLINYLSLAGLGAWLVGLWGLSSSGIFRPKPAERRRLRFEVLGALPILLASIGAIIGVFASQAYNRPIAVAAFGDIIIITLIPLALAGLFIVWLLLQHLSRIQLITNRTRTLMISGFVLAILNLPMMVMFVDPNIYLMPWYLLGGIFIIGLRNFDKELNSASISIKGVAAFIEFDKA